MDSPQTNNMQINLSDITAGSTRGIHFDDSEKVERKEEESTSNYLFGFVCGLITIACWTALSECWLFLIPLLQSEYHKPYLLRYCVLCSFSTVLIPWMIMTRCRTPITITFNLIWSGTLLTILLITVGYTWVLALDQASAAIVNSLVEFSVAICYLASVLILPDYHLTWWKNLSVSICLCGVSLIVWDAYNGNNDGHGNSWMGMLFCLISTVSFGVVKPLIAFFDELYFPVQPPMESALFMQGFLGLLAPFVLSPGLVFLHFMDIEPFELPSSRDDVLSLLIPSMIFLVYFGALIVGIAVTDAVFMSVIQLLIIPGTYVADWIYHHVSMAWPAVTGSILIVLGALMLELSVLEWTAWSRGKAPRAGYVKMETGSRMRSKVLIESSIR